MSPRFFVFIVVIILALLCGGAFFGLWFAKDSKRQIANVKEAPKTSGYLHLDGLAIPVSRREWFDYYLYLDIKIEVADDGNLKYVQRELPYLRDAALRELHKGFFTRTDSKSGLDLSVIKQRLRDCINLTLEQKLVSSVLISKLVKVGG